MASHFIILRPPPPIPLSLPSFTRISVAAAASRTYGSSPSRRNGQQARVFLLDRSVCPPSISSQGSFRRCSQRLELATCYFFKPKSELEPSPNEDDGDSEVEWSILRRWDVPWRWQTVVLTMAACGVSFVLTGLVEASILPYLGFGQELSLDEKAEILFGGQFFVTAVVLGVVYGITSTFQPLPKDLFCYDLKEPFNLRDGWLLWAGVGLLGALLAVALAGVGLNIVHGENPQRETDALIRLLPLIGSSSISTACLLGITGVLAPVLEETVFRGFLMVSLTNWFPTPVSVLISAAVFALAHLTPGEFPQLFVLGSALGFSYAQTRNLLTPITIHALWNSGVILLLTFLQIQGYDIRELLQAS